MRKLRLGGVSDMVARIVRPSCTLSWAYSWSRYRRPSHHQGRPLLIYQMGKVGSTAAFQALRTLSDYSVYHVHTLDEQRVQAAELAYRQTYPVRRLVPQHLLASRLLLSEAANGWPRGRWKVVTIVRDPVARNISSFFQDIDLRHPAFRFHQRVKGQDRSALVDDLLELFVARHDHREPLRWFDRELKCKLGIDVFASPFAAEQGWSHFSSDCADLLLFRLEDLKCNWDAGMSVLLGCTAPPLAVANAASQKDYADLYAAFKERLVLSRSYLDELYGSRFARHFYSAGELTRMAERWTCGEPMRCRPLEAQTCSEVKASAMSRRVLSMP